MNHTHLADAEKRPSRLVFWFHVEAQSAANQQHCIQVEREMPLFPVCQNDFCTHGQAELSTDPAVRLSIVLTLSSVNQSYVIFTDIVGRITLAGQSLQGRVLVFMPWVSDMQHRELGMVDLHFCGWCWDGSERQQLMQKLPWQLHWPAPCLAWLGLSAAPEPAWPLLLPSPVQISPLMPRSHPAAGPETFQNTVSDVSCWCPNDKYSARAYPAPLSGVTSVPVLLQDAFGHLVNLVERKYCVLDVAMMAMSRLNPDDAWEPPPLPVCCKSSSRVEFFAIVTYLFVIAAVAFWSPLQMAKVSLHSKSQVQGSPIALATGVLPYLFPVIAVVPLGILLGSEAAQRPHLHALASKLHRLFVSVMSPHQLIDGKLLG